MPVLVEEEDQTPMLEMAARVGAGAGEITEVPPALGGALDAAERGAAGGDDDDDDRLSLLALEYAVGTGVPSDWDAAEPDAPCGEDCGDGDGPLARGARLSGASARLGARRLGYLAVLKWRDLSPGEVAAPSAAARRMAELQCVVGPFWPAFWPFTLLVTYPLIFCVSGAVAFAVLPDHAVATRVAWACGVLRARRGSVVPRAGPGRAPAPPGEARRGLALERPGAHRPPGPSTTGRRRRRDGPTVRPWTGTGIGEKNRRLPLA
ncbi:protein-cysteine S-palmitoyltransferase [Aureococcus anophagefferens]|nr:protein-cysteine S-palmitoyltransferase [Aureococcus anophagefferens]